MKAETVSAWSNVIPRRRDQRGNPIPRRIVAMEPVLSHDPEALMEAAETARRSPDEARKMIPWLMASNAVAAQENLKLLRREMTKAITERNEQLEHGASRLRPKLELVQKELADREAELAMMLAPLGVKTKDGSSLEFADDEPVSLEILAGQPNLPSPLGRRSILQGWLHKLVSVVGSGVLLGISLGLLVDKLELVSFAREWPMLLLFALVGIAVMTMIAALFCPLAEETGDALYRAGKSAKGAQWLLPGLYGLLLVGMAIAVIVIESKTEQLGLFKAVQETASLQAIELSRSDLPRVSLMLVVPTIASHIALGLIEGEHRANLARLRHLQHELRQKLLSDPRFQSAAEMAAKVHACRSVSYGWPGRLRKQRLASGTNSLRDNCTDWRIRKAMCIIWCTRPGRCCRETEPQWSEAEVVIRQWHGSRLSSSSTLRRCQYGCSQSVGESHWQTSIAGAPKDGFPVRSSIRADSGSISHSSC